MRAITFIISLLVATVCLAGNPVSNSEANTSLDNKAINVNVNNVSAVNTEDTELELKSDIAINVSENDMLELHIVVYEIDLCVNGENEAAGNSVLETENAQKDFTTRNLL